MKRRKTRKPKTGRLTRIAKSVRKSAPKRVVRKARAPVAAKPADDIGALMAAAAKAFGLPLDPAWHRGVAFNLGLILRLAALVDEFPLPDEIEPAAVFHA